MNSMSSMSLPRCSRQLLLKLPAYPIAGSGLASCCWVSIFDALSFVQVSPVNFSIRATGCPVLVSVGAKKCWLHAVSIMHQMPMPIVVLALFTGIAACIVITAMLVFQAHCHLIDMRGALRNARPAFCAELTGLIKRPNVIKAIC